MPSWLSLADECRHSCPLSGIRYIIIVSTPFFISPAYLDDKRHSFTRKTDAATRNEVERLKVGRHGGKGTQEAHCVPRMTSSAHEWSNLFEYLPMCRSTEQDDVMPST